ncbi:hypothetical protein AGABI1DRAFT_108522 [Agaricus bisporus var. burnettii JB137-S8]|uniref:Uncharacterized protein n=1 Tax=Agaricus bisporus var. burnettii (strain JB137-S8 / ATCC MYA-4627 / FGSC 10392) TaxID=597362 RepID=K5WNJ7_AGABU|nr:uncharacterized protein AGABI1DRAFT_108522 [Agaricus bisporus var. burnettii JB137-S8]EKM76911.1 hypothetical protein AGABI1DRAFT_108522 [Agaricus bisporus var. burnettii JB137-S8]
MVVILLFICSTTVLGLQLALVMRSYMYLLQSREDDFETERRAFILSQGVLLIFQTIIADSVLLFRCWTIWNKMILAIVLPLVLWAGCLGSSVYAIYCLYFRIFTGPKPISTEESVYPAFVTFWTCTIIVNIYCTGMIVGRICSVQQGWRPPSICSLRDLPQRTRLHLAKRIVVESAMIYTAASLGAFISHACESRAVDITYLADRESELCVRCFNPKTNRSKADATVGTTDSVDIPDASSSASEGITDWKQ